MQKFITLSLGLFSLISWAQVSNEEREKNLATIQLYNQAVHCGELSLPAENRVFLIQDWSKGDSIRRWYGVLSLVQNRCQKDKDNQKFYFSEIYQTQNDFRVVKGDLMRDLEVLNTQLNAEEIIAINMQQPFVITIKIKEKSGEEFIYKILLKDDDYHHDGHKLAKILVNKETEK